MCVRQTLKQFISTLRRLAAFLLRCTEPTLAAHGTEMYRYADGWGTEMYRYADGWGTEMYRYADKWVTDV